MSLTASLRRAALVAVCCGLSATGAFVSPASAACTETPPGGTTVTCEGDLSAGIAFSNSPYTNLIVESLTHPIGPGLGIEFTTTSGTEDITFSAALGAHGVAVVANSRNGILVTNELTVVSNSADALATGGDVGVEIDGTVSKSGDSSNAVRVQSTANALHDAVGNATSQGGDVGILITGLATSTAGTGSVIHAYTGANAYTTEGDSTATGGTFTITTDVVSSEGDGASGIYVSNFTNTNAAVAGLASSVSGDLTVTSVGSITTKGKDSYGIVADSTATSNGISGAYAKSGIAVVTTNGIHTKGVGAAAISASTGAIATTKNGSAMATGGSTVVITEGLIKTEGNNSIAVAASGYTDATVTENGNATAYAPSVDASVNDVETHGYGAHGVAGSISARAKVVGNGFASASGGTLNIASNGTISTYGEYANGIDVALGASATKEDAAGVAPAISIGASATIEAENILTYEHASSGIFARPLTESFNYGDGSAGATGGKLQIDVANIETLADEAEAIDVLAETNSTVIGTGNATSIAGAIEVNAGRLETHGVAYPLSIESKTSALGTPSGTGEFNATGALIKASVEEIETAGDNVVGIDIQSTVRASTLGNGTSTATAADIEVTSSKITMLGASAVGIFVQNTAMAETDIGGTGTATTGNVTVSAHDIDMRGTGAFAIQAGTTANGQTSAKAGDVLVKTTGTVASTSANGVGIIIGSTSGSSGTATNGNLTVDIASGSVTGGFLGVYFSSGATNTLSNKGVLSAVSGLAVIGAAGDETIENQGLLKGSVDLGSGANAFNNLADGVFESGDLVNLGTDRAFKSSGIISPGGNGMLQTTSVHGDFEQKDGGKWFVDADWTAPSPGNADLIVVTGAARLAGTVVAIPANFPITTGATKQFHIMAAAGGIDMLSITAADTAAVDYELEKIGNDLFLNATIDFLGTPGGLNHNQTAIAGYLNAALGGSTPPGFASVLSALVSLPDKPALAAALDQLSPEIYSYAKIETLFASEQFSSDLMSCRVADGDGYAVIREGQCIWARARARHLDLDATYENLGADATAGSFSAGGQVAVVPSVRLGFAIGYDDISLDSGGNTRANGDRVNVGAVAKYERGPLLLAASVAGGWSDLDASRQIAFGGFSAATSADTSIDYGLARLHAAYLIERAAWYAKPLVDATVTRIEFDGVDETGGSGAALLVASGTDTIFSVSPAIEVGSEYRFSALSVVRPFLRGGVTWRDAHSIDLTASFAALPASVGAFTIETALDDLLVDVAAGFDLLNSDGAVLRIQYDGRFGDETAQNSASVKGSVPF